MFWFSLLLVLVWLACVWFVSFLACSIGRLLYLTVSCLPDWLLALFVSFACLFYFFTLLTYLCPSPPVEHRPSTTPPPPLSPNIALCSGLLWSFRTSWSPAVSALLQCFASDCCEVGLSSSSPAGSRSGLGVWCWMLAS